MVAAWTPTPAAASHGPAAGRRQVVGESALRPAARGRRGGFPAQPASSARGQQRLQPARARPPRPAPDARPDSPPRGLADAPPGRQRRSPPPAAACWLRGCAPCPFQKNRARACVAGPRAGHACSERAPLLLLAGHRSFSPAPGPGRAVITGRRAAQSTSPPTERQIKAPEGCLTLSAQRAGGDRKAAQ
ncbi:unnamed protein product [Rangifer tarandus platyrhynchus]|uniref:Uncharacterized protein n=1 Tax=Rangifer tarandus platyrhynchus TaxID=3082113 RepID=A0ABN8ZIQ7_RANTA|nr:unnamed protein product [Rangifer tarandus platyrhynchus]